MKEIQELQTVTDGMRIMMPRYRVSQECYPDAPFKPGEIVTLNQLTINGTWYWTSPNGVMCMERFFIQYPSIFEKVPWYIGRVLAEMPLYVKRVKPGSAAFMSVEWMVNLETWYWRKTSPGFEGSWEKASEVEPYVLSNDYF